MKLANVYSWKPSSTYKVPLLHLIHQSLSNIPDPFLYVPLSLKMFSKHIISSNIFQHINHTNNHRCSIQKFNDNTNFINLHSSYFIKGCTSIQANTTYQSYANIAIQKTQYDHACIFNLFPIFHSSLTSSSITLSQINFSIHLSPAAP